MNLLAEQTIWYPGIYHGRQTAEYTQTVAETLINVAILLVQKRAQEDGEWAIEQGHVGENEDKMRRMMAWVSDEKNIWQCLKQVGKDGLASERTIDWVCRDLANASKWSVQ